LTKTRQKNADQSIRLLKFIESIDEKTVSPLDKKISENLKQKYSNAPLTFQALF
jgi:hypothetical protein